MERKKQRVDHRVSRRGLKAVTRKHFEVCADPGQNIFGGKYRKENSFVHIVPLFSGRSRRQQHVQFVSINTQSSNILSAHNSPNTSDLWPG